MGERFSKTHSLLSLIADAYNVSKKLLKLAISSYFDEVLGGSFALSFFLSPRVGFMKPIDFRYFFL